MNSFKIPSAQQPVAIIGMACRFPGAYNYDAFWQNLLEARSSISEIPTERWNWKDYHTSFPGNGQSGKWGGFISNADSFDASFFQLSGKEAEQMDPQQRIMLELSWNCMEDAGLPPFQLSGSDTGIFMGVFNHDYKELAERSNVIQAHYGTGTSAAIVANRLSHFYNFKGPSVPIDTACSSSLQALHMAAQAIQTGECELAMAGGISLMFTPAKHIAFAKAGMLSPTGSCKSFDESADGYVRSEGAGILLLKALDRAQEDGDTIYGVLRGSAVNHCGKTYTLTYPSPIAQAEVIARALKRSGFAPETISYIEAHGTGTPKGDPIELEGLVSAFTTHFQPDRGKSGYCGVGSVKANIGHLESAAGIAGVIKVLLAMKYQRLPGLMHFKQLNSSISLENTPFYIVDRPRNWTPPKDELGKPYPRRAGVSSFGFGGTNAHVILEESPAIARADVQKRPAYLICVSAKNMDIVKKRIAELERWINSGVADADLANISFTLLTGRTHFNVRESFVVTDLDSLSLALRNALNTNDETKKILLPEQQQEADKMLSDWNTQNNLADGIYLQRLAHLAELYVLGYNGNWSELFQQSGAHRIALPAYPFQVNRHWLTECRPPAYMQSTDQSLSTENHSSDPSATVFSGNESFLKDHVINKQKILPAVVYMELVRKAVYQLVSKDLGETDVFCLKNIAWTSPFIVNENSAELHLDIEKKQGGTLYYEAFSRDELHNKTVHCCGTACLAQGKDVPVLDASSFAVQEGIHPMEGAYFYKLLTTAGFDYGPSHQMIHQLRICNEKIVARLKTSITSSETASFVLHPGLMDAALQTTMGWLAMDISTGIPVKTPLPFAMKEVEVFALCMNIEWVVVSARAPSQQAGAPLDIDLCDGSGKVCVRITGYIGRTTARSSATIDLRHDDDVHKLEAFWTSQTANPAETPHFDSHVLVICQSGLSLPADNDPKWQGIEHYVIENGPDDMESGFNHHCWKLLELTQDLATKAQGKVLFQLVIDNQYPNRLLAGLSGMLKTVSAEYVKIQTQIIEVPAFPDNDQLMQMLLTSKQHAGDHHIRFENGKRLVKTWRKVEEQNTIQNPWKNNGIYLITGGMGGLGLIFAMEIARKVSRATVILTGRSSLTAASEARLNALQGKGSTFIYRKLDVTNAADVGETIAWIKQAFGGLHAILHAAGVINDNYLIRKTKDELEKVLAPKVAGLLHLDEASADMPLDFFALFSSTSGVLGNIGQADYASANAFMDEYAQHRNLLTAKGLRNGKTISISWPFWKEGGMRLTDTGMAALYRYAGMIPLETEKGINAFYGVIGSEHGHVLVMQGDPTLLSRKLNCNLLEKAIPEPGHQEPLNEPKMAHQENKNNQDLIQTLVLIASDILKSSPSTLDPIAPLDEYGFDSILYTEFALKLSETFESDITPALFFQHTTISSLADFISNAHGALMSPATDASHRAIPAETIRVEDTSTPGKADRLAGLTATLCSYAAEVLRMPLADINPAIGLDEYSYDSIRYTEFAIKINEGFNLHIAPTIFFEFATLNALAGHLMGQLPESFESQPPSKDAHKQPETFLINEQNISNGSETNGQGKVDPASAPIAIIGISGSFAMSEDVAELWTNLIEERDCISEIPADRWDWRTHYGNAVAEPDKTDVKWGGFVKDLNTFDASFFHISPGEAAYIDPQQRLLLMHVWKALEDAGYAPEQFNGSNTALFTGITSHEYSARVSKMNVKTEGYHQSSIISCIGPNRVSYFLNLHGTSEPVDTACSSSLVAIHRAVREIRSGDSDMAIAGGVTVLSSLPSYISFDKAGMLSKDGRSKTFSDQANGYARAEGAGIMLLKRLEAAERDGDHIYGVIRSTAVNHGGRANSLSAPNMRAQAALLHTAYSKAGIDPRTVGYIEAHGTGTKLGDPIEIDALKAAFKELYKETGSEHVRDTHCGIGSVKTNIGHSEYAAGMAGIMKVLMQMKHRTLTRSLHCDTINPYINLKGSPFFIVQKTQEWKALPDENGHPLPRRAGVSSFGFGGVNAHVVIEEYIDHVSHNIPIHGFPALFVFSAKKPAQLRAQAQQFATLIASGSVDNSSLADLAYTLQVGRNAMEERMCILAKTFEELRTKLERFLSSDSPGEGIFLGHLKKIKTTVNQPETDQGIINLMRTRDHQGIARSWVEGQNIPWTELYGAKKPRRISLPTYPFARNEFKLDAEYALSTPAPQFAGQSPANQMPAAETFLNQTPVGQTPVGQTPVGTPQDVAKQHADELIVGHIQQTLIEGIARLLNMDAKNLAVDENLDEYGFDSVLYTQFAIELNDRFSLDLTPAIFFRYPNLEQLAAHLCKEYQDVFEQTFGMNAQPDSEPVHTATDSPAASSGAAITQVLIQKVAQILKFSEDMIEPDTDLNEYGLDSIIITQLTNELNAEFGMELTPNTIFGCQNLNALTIYLHENYPDSFLSISNTLQIDSDEENSSVLQSGIQPPKRAPNDRNDHNAVAIVGLSLQFPMAKDANQFWDNLMLEKHCISEVPADRWDWRDYPDLKIKWGGFMDDMATFDPLFFKISPAEALQMYPQQRLMMQHTWKAIEDAGYDPQSLSGSNTGIFMGILCYEYSKLLGKADVPIASHSLMGMVGSMGPNRMSYFLDIHGPSEAIETACSSSLVAIHRAVEAIRSGSCDAALAGGVNTLLSPDVFMSLFEAGTLSPDGCCRPFSDQAKGYVRGEGAGVLFLKRLEDAERDGDHIYAIIRGTSENHGGRANTLTSPNPKAQTALLQGVYSKAGIDPRTVGYIETHGTGTELGDPIEVSALRKAFGSLYEQHGTAFNGNKHCGIGSVKSNIGHLEVAAGVAGVAKVLLQLKHQKRIKSLHCDRLNPYIDFSDSPFYVVRETEEWKAVQNESGEQLPRRAGVSSFGFGGVSAHIVLEEYVPRKHAITGTDSTRQLVVLSARNSERLREQIQNLRNAIENRLIESDDLQRLAYTLQVGREHMEERYAVVVGSISQLSVALTGFLNGAYTDDEWYQGNVKSKLTHSTEKPGIAAEDSLVKLAKTWISGEPVDWDSLHPGKKPVRMSLPTYPFERKRYWPADAVHARANGQMNEPAGALADEEGNLQVRAIRYFKSTISQLVQIPVREIEETEILIHYGVDSIAISRLLVKMRNVMPRLTNSVIFEHPTIAELVGYLLQNESEGLQKLLGERVENKEERFFSGNSLILLNEGAQGRPVFWFHPGGGGIDGYQYMAQVSDRPFYGIVADQWIREKQCVQGIPEMAARYLNMIKAVQPVGPYDLGGFSLGGALAYEIARQLQIQGQSVSTITMIDSIYVPGFMGKFLLDYKTMLLQTVNLLLLAQVPGNRQTSHLIHSSELDHDAPDKSFLDQITALARSRGLTYPSRYLEAIVTRALKVRDASRFTEYAVQPLPDPANVRCHYFANGARSFYGSLAPYFILDDRNNMDLEQLDYWSAWQKHLVHFTRTDLNATDHVTLMNDRAVIQPVIDLCRQLYAVENSNARLSHSLK